MGWALPGLKRRAPDPTGHIWALPDLKRRARELSEHCRTGKMPEDMLERMLEDMPSGGLNGLYDCRCHMYCFHMPPNSIHFKLGKHCASPWWSKVSEHHHIISHASIRDERHYKSMNKGKKRLRRSQAW